MADSGSPAQLDQLEQQQQQDADVGLSHARRRRERLQLSCNYCRRRKSKCNRQQPCSTCALRGHVCEYPDYRGLPPSQPAPTALPDMHHRTVHDRIVHLERLVMSLVSGAQTAASSTPGALPGVAVANPTDGSSLDTPLDDRSECGSMRLSASEIRYVNSNHWAAILDSLADLREHFDREEQHRLADISREEDEEGGGLPLHSSLLYGSCRSVSRADILAALPPRSAVDRYISRYFNLIDLAASFFHGPTFIREYETFWSDPSGASIMWVGLLYSMICLAVLASDVSDRWRGHEPDQQSLQIGLYREKIAQCLILGEYTRGGPYSLQTLIHYVHIEFLSSPDAERDIWFLIGLVQSLARRMGYHRDPSHFDGISPLQAEMWRRAWVTVLQGDILISSQMGMPRLISDCYCDTLEPRNLNDADLDEAIPELPPSRPETELTTSLEYIARRRVLLALGAVLDITVSVKPPSYAEVMRVDGVLNDAAASIPPPLQMKSMAASITDTPQVIMARLFLSHIVHKGHIFLHRRYLFAEIPFPEAQEEDPFAYSRKACLNACLGTLQIQHILDEETRPGGQLRMMRWRVTSSMNHAFLTATMILCAALHRGQIPERQEEIIASLRRSRTIWMRAMASSREAKKAAEIVSFVLARTGNGRGRGETTEGQDMNMMQDFVGFDETNRFIAPPLLGAFTPPGQEVNVENPTFDLDNVDLSAVLDEWLGRAPQEGYPHAARIAG